MTKALDDANKKDTTKQDDEDMAVLAFSNTLPGNDDAPVEVKTDTQKVAAEAKAEAELAALQNNDATSAFAQMVAADGPISLAQTKSKS